MSQPMIVIIITSIIREASPIPAALRIDADVWKSHIQHIKIKIFDIYDTSNKIDDENVSIFWCLFNGANSWNVAVTNLETKHFVWK